MNTVIPMPIASADDDAIVAEGVSMVSGQSAREPFVLDDGHLAVPTGPGLGVAPLPDRLAEVTTSTEWLAV